MTKEGFCGIMGATDQTKATMERSRRRETAREVGSRTENPTQEKPAEVRF